MTSILRQIWLFVRLSRPIFLVGGALVYATGAAIAHYLGIKLDTARYLIGQGLVLCIQLMAQYLNEYFDAAGDRTNTNRTPLSGGSGVLGADGLKPQVALYAAIACMALTASLSTALLTLSDSSILAWAILFLGLLGAISYSAPPLRLVASGYGELIVSVLVAALVPAFAFVLQTGELHVLLAASSMPLIALHLAMLIVLEFPDYAADHNSGKRTLTVRLGWRMAMRIHDFSLGMAVLSLVIALWIGMPTRIAISMAIALPLAAAQIWQLSRIRRGLPPRWRILTIGGVALFILAVYFELIGFVLA
ncbi:MAG TPA: prenyltransferase [Anaerolineae bacterium]|nr:prenyltransferase [Anaerolineae bacterium]